MGKCPVGEMMHYERKYIQFNELVFADVDASDYDASFKTYDTDYGFSHGSYSPQKKLGGYLNMTSVDMTLSFDLKKLPCEERPYYVRFIKSQLTTQGKLWAIQDNTIIWAHAYLTDYSSSTDARKDTYEVDVSFDLPEGYWHKANTLRTFLVPFDVCDFMECYEYKDVKLCKKGDCCDCHKTEPIIGKCYKTMVGEPGCCGCVEIETVCCGECDQFGPDDALCYHDDLQSFYQKCYPKYKIVYSCEMADRYFTDFLNDDNVGQKFCSECGDIIAGILYSDTDIPTEGVKITLHGTMHNPYIEINGNGNTIKGDYDGVLVINPDGSVYSYADGCKCDEPLPASVWVVPVGNDYGWTVNQGNNRIVIDSGACCHICAWIEVDALTI